MNLNLLLHICCGVCASRTIEKLQPDYDITGFFYNPNIEPPDEYKKRLNAASTLAKHCGIKLIIGDYDNNSWHGAITGLEHLTEGGRRCWRCFRFRLQNTAILAKSKHIDYYTTTLTASPYKNTKVINTLGDKIGRIYGLKFVDVNFHSEDFYKPSLARKLKLYHQKYCGCDFSVK